ncbi:MAG: class I SAM-dependent methyltransferase [Myxococcales bacterium]|nr:class I SAM-dependent methyltransferase [Myxococcales bacterium]
MHQTPRTREGSAITDDFPDHFSRNASAYAQFRPTYPDALYEAIAALVPRRSRCWDCATGSGQAAVALSRWFEQVVATDASASQLRHATPHPKVEYRQETAESTTLEDASVDLIAVAAALHWLDLDAFYAQVRRVAAPGAVLAAWSYGTVVEVSAAVDPIVERYASEVLASFWAPQFTRVQTRYGALDFPFAPLDIPPHAAEAHWTMEQFLGMLDTWSAAAAYEKHHGRPATSAIREDLASAWGDPEHRRQVRLPLYHRIGRVHPLG